MASAGAAQGASFTLALEKFKAGLSEDEKNDFQFTTIEDLRAALKRIQDKHASERRQQWMGMYFYRRSLAPVVLDLSSQDHLYMLFLPIRVETLLT